MVAPIYPALVAAAFRTFGRGTIAAAAILSLNGLFSVFTVAVVHGLARRALDVRRANLAAFMCAVWLPLVILQGTLWETSLSALLLTASVLVAIQLKAEEHLRTWLVAGLAGGVAVLANPALLFTLASLALWAAWKRQTVAKLCVAGIALLAVLTPWEVRCWRALHAFVPVRSGMALELWIGNHAGADGNWHASLHPVASDAERERFAELGEIGYMREKQAAFCTFVREHPWGFASLTARRIVRYWLGISPSDWPISASFLGAAITGIWLMRTQRAALPCTLPLLVFPLPYYVTHPDMRFRCVLDPLLLLFAANAVARFLAWVGPSPVTVGAETASPSKVPGRSMHADSAR